MRKNNKKKTHIKSRGEMSNSAQKGVSLNTQSGKLGDTFLGYKTKNVNQMWDWRTLEDVVFK